MRGRSNNSNNNSGNRRGPNPLTRSYESNGPDVKIRGNAHHVAEKYLQLARDAQSSGDPVAAESYLQHAEHYFRLIASAQQAQAGYNRQPDTADLDGEDDDDSGIPDRFASPPAATPYVAPQQPQPYAAERQPYVNNAERQPYGTDRQQGQSGERQPYAERQGYNGERPQQQDRNSYAPRNNQDRNNQDRNGAGRRPFRDDRNQDQRGGEDRGQDRFNRNRQDRGNYDGRNGQDRSFVAPQAEAPRDPYAGEQPRVEAADRQPRTAVPERQPEAVMPPPVSPRPESVPRLPPAVADEAPGLPSFITTPTRVVPTETAAAEPSLATASAFPGDEAGEPTKFPRRRRRPTRAAAADAGEAVAEPSTSDD